MRTFVTVAFVAAVVIGCSNDSIVTPQRDSGINGIWEERFTLTYTGAIGPIDHPPEEYDVELLSSLHLQDGRFNLVVRPADAGGQQIVIMTNGRYCIQGDTLALLTDGSETDCGSTSHLFRFSVSGHDLHVCDEPRMVNDSIMAFNLLPLLWQYVDVWFVRSPYKRCGNFCRGQQLPGAGRPTL